MISNKSYIIGLDLGDGESCLAYVASDSSERPSVYRSPSGNGSIPSAIAFYKRGLKIYVAIGEDALLIEGKTDLNINFKWDPIVEPEQWEHLKGKALKFVETLFKEFSEKHPTVAENCEIYIGCPSGWTEKSRKIYEKLFCESQILPISRVYVVPEAWAALIQARDFENLPSELVDKRLLLIDIGSSTTDVAILDGLVPSAIEEVGHNLGLRQVDAQLLDKVCKTQTIGQTIEELISKDLVNYEMLLFTCRLAKEHAFGRTIDPTNLFRDHDWLKKCWELLLSFDLKDCLQSATFWHDEPWLERYRSLLHYLQKSDKVRDPRVVMVTGGGSNIMPLVKEAGEAFPNAYLVRGLKPAFSVACGLAGYGRWRKRCEGFRSDAMALVQKVLAKSECTSEYGSFAGEIVRLLFESSVEAIWRPMASQWAKGELNLRHKGGVQAYARQLYGNWLEESDHKYIFEQEFRRLSAAINLLLKDEMAELNKKYNLSVKDFTIEVQLSPLELFKPSSRESFMAKTVGIYEEVVFQVIDRLPLWIRKVADSSRALDTALKVETLLKRAFGAIARVYVEKNIPDEMKQLITNFVMEEAEREIEEQLDHVKKLLLESHKSLKH
jgi:hypothetical protein